MEGQTDHPLEVDGSITSSTEEIGIHDDRLPDIEQYLCEVVDVVDCLLDLLPSLLDPVPEDSYNKATQPEDAIEDIKLATLLFPKASKGLAERLGKANWRRRQNLKQASKRSSALEAAKAGQIEDGLGLQSNKSSILSLKFMEQTD